MIGEEERILMPGTARATEGSLFHPAGNTKKGSPASVLAIQTSALLTENGSYGIP